MPGDHEVLSEVFQDAFGPSYVESMEDQKIMLRKSKERESSQYIAEGYTIPNGAPSQHTDTEVGSIGELSFSLLDSGCFCFCIADRSQFFKYSRDPIYIGVYKFLYQKHFCTVCSYFVDLQ